MKAGWYSGATVRYWLALNGETTPGSALCPSKNPIAMILTFPGPELLERRCHGTIGSRPSPWHTIRAYPVAGVSLQFLTERLELADQLRAGRKTMLTPQDLPGRYGRVVKAVDHLLDIMQCPSVLAGGWAVWRYGFIGRVTQDIDIVLPADRIDEFVRLAVVSGFEVLPQPEGRWPKVRHKDTDVQVDILPENARPGTTAKLAPTTIRHPLAIGGEGSALVYVSFPALVELKIAAGRIADEHDVVELIRTNPGQIENVRRHLAAIHADYVLAFDALARRAATQEER